MTTTQPMASGREPPAAPARFTRTTQQAIVGRYRSITTHQLAMSWWLHREGHITRRQLRIFFAAHEMAERRCAAERAGGVGGQRSAFGLDEIVRLVGGRGSETAHRELRADVRQLAALGLVTITDRAITFAQSIEQIRLDVDLASFWAFFQALPNRRRSVPVPRRTLRALAAGFSRAATAYILAALIRSLFWHRQPGGGGEYTTDGRTKLSWVADVFGISRRAATDARGHLIALGWLHPQETPQWALNRWGVHDVVNVDWTPCVAPVDSSVENSAAHSVEDDGRAAGSASPLAENAGGSASPCLNSSSLSSRDSKTRSPGASAPDPSGVFNTSDQEEGSRKRRERPGRSGGKPNIRDIRREDLKDPEALRELRTQAIGLGFAFAGECGELDFFALANRAITRGQRPGALFFDLISNHRTAFITIADEEAARVQIRELRSGPDMRRGKGGEQPPAPRRPELSEEERIVEACIQVAKQHRIEDPFRVARKAKGWTRDQWDDAHLAYITAQAQRRQPAAVGYELGAF